MWIPAGEIDRSASVPELIRSEFTRFNDLQRHYAHNYQYPAEGVFEEKSSASYAVFPKLRELGAQAVISSLIVPDGQRLTIPLSSAMERSVPIFYRDAPRGESSLWSQLVVVAARKTKAEDNEIHPWALPEDEDFDELVSVGVGVVAMKKTTRLGGYDLSLTLRQVGDEHKVFTSRTISLQPKERLVFTDSEVRYDVPEEAQKDLIQLFRTAVWETVSEPA